MPVKLRAHHRLTIVRVEILAELASDAAERAATERVLAEVVIRVERDDRVDAAEVLVAHRDAAGALIVRVVAEVARLETANAQGEIRPPAGPCAALRD